MEIVDGSLLHFQVESHLASEWERPIQSASDPPTPPSWANGKCDVQHAARPLRFYYWLHSGLSIMVIYERDNVNVHEGNRRDNGSERYAAQPVASRVRNNFHFFFEFFSGGEEKCCLPPGHRGLQFTNRRLTQNWNDGKETKQRPVYSAAVKNTDIILTYCCCLQPFFIYQLRGAYLKLSMSVVWDLKWSIQLE